MSAECHSDSHLTASSSVPSHPEVVPGEEDATDAALRDVKEQVRDTAIFHVRTYISQRASKPKANRRLSARLTGWAKGFGKKENGSTPKDEVPAEAAELKVGETSMIANEAPKLEKPILAEPLKIDEVSRLSSFVPGLMRIQARIQLLHTTRRLYYRLDLPRRLGCVPYNGLGISLIEYLLVPVCFVLSERHHLPPDPCHFSRSLDFVVFGARPRAGLDAMHMLAWKVFAGGI